MEDKVVNLHEGHRQRLKTKVKKGGLNVLDEHEVLELLLTYTIPRKDTNPLAHRLIMAYGGLSGVLRASYEDLKKCEGVGDETALFISMLPQLFERFIANNKNIDFLRNTKDCVNYFISHFSVSDKEKLIVVCSNNMNRFVKSFVIAGYSDVEISFDLKEFANQIMDKRVKNIVLYHTHPAGSVEPSMQDIKTTEEILQLCCMFNINLCDHLIFNEFNHFSFGTSGLLYNLYSKVKNKFPNNRNIEKMMQNIGFLQKPEEK